MWEFFVGKRSLGERESAFYLDNYYRGLVFGWCSTNHLIILRQQCQYDRVNLMTVVRGESGPGRERREREGESERKGEKEEKRERSLPIADH